MNTRLLAILAGAAFPLVPLAATAAAACPGGASWCEDFEHGTGTLSGPGGARPVPLPQGIDNHVLLLRAEDRPLLLSTGETAAHAKGAYFVEARLRPAPSGDGAPRQAYVIARYADERNWLGFGLAFVPGSRRLGIEIVKMEDGKLRPLRKASAEIGAPGSFYTVRLDIDGSALTMYVNGHRITGFDAPALPAGRIGLVAEGGDVEFDDMRVGDARRRRARGPIAHRSGADERAPQPAGRRRRAALYRARTGQPWRGENGFHRELERPGGCRRQR
jgi:hypothetical protein